MSRKGEPTVYVVDASPQVRLGIERQLRAAHLHATTFATAEEFRSHYDEERPGCLVVDDRSLKLLTTGIRLPVIVISAVAEVPKVVTAIRAGAVDFLEKPVQEEALLRAVREGLAKDKERRADEARLASLTARERQVLELLVAGENYKEIAGRLQVSPKTVEGHRVNLLRKLGLRSVVEAVRFVLDRHLS